MSSGFTTERRRTPRTEVGDSVECRLELRTRVRMVDISLTGALLATDLELPVGASAELRSGLGAGAFHTVVQVRRNVELSARVPMKGLGASFTTMGERSRRSLEEFLRKASQ